MERLARIAGLKTRRFLGMMSGTSCDGIDACLVAFGGEAGAPRWRILAFEHMDYPGPLRETLLRLAEAETVAFDEIPRVHVALGGVFGDFARRIVDGLPPRIRPHVVASHGHTLRHLPDASPLFGQPTRSTFQIGEAAVIAERTGLPVVADFRPADLAAGGQGAPLVAFVDRLCFARDDRPVALLNLGGIANLSILPPRGSDEIPLAFDTGPANMLVDAAMVRISGGRLAFDRDGETARRGRVSETLLARWMDDSYVRRRPPKTTGRERYGRAFLEKTFDEARAAGLSDADWVATLTRFTAASVAWNLNAWASFLTAETPLQVCGGGARNPALMDFLRQELAPRTVRPLRRGALDAEAKEAFSFALLGDEALAGRSTNLPAATGARHGVPLGKWSLPPNASIR